MTKGEAKTLVRLLSGRTDFEPTLLDYFLDLGRRELETRENLYWMRTVATFNMTVAQSSYYINASPIVYTAPATPTRTLKDIRFLLWKAPTSIDYQQISPANLDVLETNFSTTTTGKPEAYCLENDAILHFFPIPDVAYNIRLHEYVWTSNPTSDLSTDELLTRWPDLLINASVAHAILHLTREQSQAAPWFSLVTKEMDKLREYNRARGEEGIFDLIPQRGPTHMQVPARQVSQRGRISRWSSY